MVSTTMSEAERACDRMLAQTTQPILLIQDGAKYHTSAVAKAFFAQQTAQLESFQLPTYSPDYNPIEKL